MKRFAVILLSLLAVLPVFSNQVLKEKATVSYYADKFHGRKTASGETFNMNALTCAHKTLPFGTILKVTNLANGKSVQVRVNDRGPFVEHREADLSKAAAIKLDMIKSGTAQVKIEIVQMGANTKRSSQTASKAKSIPIAAEGSGAGTNGPMKKTATASAAATAKPAAAAKSAGTKVATAATTATRQITVKANSIYDIQLGTFSDPNNARERAKQLMHDNIGEVVLQRVDTGTRVLVRKIEGRNVPEAVKKLHAKGYTDYIIKERHK